VTEEKRYNIQDEKLGFVKFLYQYYRNGKPVSIIHADPEKFAQWILEVEERIGKLEKTVVDEKQKEKEA
jgi:hypothetical protein